jgi:predicted nucleotidyltransferase
MDKKAAFESVRKYISFLRENDFNIRKAYIFGSYAKGSFNDDSDIDLAVVMNDLSNSFLMQVELMKISRKFDTRIEPHPFDEADFDPSNPFAHEVLSTGVQIL